MKISNTKAAFFKTEIRSANSLVLDAGQRSAKVVVMSTAFKKPGCQEGLPISW
jgi:hypothetical protein